jgi:hypothetical protein
MTRPLTETRGFGGLRANSSKRLRNFAAALAAPRLQ